MSCARLCWRPQAAERAERVESHQDNRSRRCFAPCLEHSRRRPHGEVRLDSPRRWGARGCAPSPGHVTGPHLSAGPWAPNSLLGTSEPSVLVPQLGISMCFGDERTND